jgi:hypothetical protein
MNIYEKCRNIRCDDINDNTISLHGITRYIKITSQEGYGIQCILRKASFILEYHERKQRDEIYEMIMDLEIKAYKFAQLLDNFDE